MKFKPFKRIPAWIALGVIVGVGLVRWLRLDFFERLERMTYDMRARQAVKSALPVANNLGFVFIDEESLHYVKTNRAIGFHFGLYWPRQVYGRLVREMADQGAKAVALDILFGDLRDDHPEVRMADGEFVESDVFFARQMQHASNVIIAVTKEAVPPPLFLTNALTVGDISTEKDSDGILRRTKAFRVYRRWHPAFRQVEADPDFGVDLAKARIEPRRIVLPRPGSGLEAIKIPLDAAGNFDLADFVGDAIPRGMARKAKPFTEERVWHMGVALAARELKLDLAKAQVDLPHGRITLRGAGGVERIIPVDQEGYFYIDWCLPPDDRRLMLEPIQNLLGQSLSRLQGPTNQIVGRWAGKLAVVGSAAVLGNDLTDRGATPLRNDTLLVSKHWNVANSVITGRFVRRAPPGVELALIAAMGLAAALLTWELRAWLGSALVALAAIGYAGFSVVLYTQTRYWLPLVMPVAGAMLTTHVCLLTWRVVFEQAERRRVKSIFSKIVSPKIVHELLEAESLSLVGSRRQVTVLFADVRGFTEFTDTSQEQVAELVRQRNLRGAAAEACFDEQARETLATVNLYLGLLADIVIKQDGTLDKFIGDCVMAFWGAPSPNPKHAVACVRAAIEAQRAIHSLNLQRAAENPKRELENRARLSAGLPPKPLFPVLKLGTGINTGMATVGLMGSRAEQQNYTVFGREVNLASRLESASGQGRIFIGETTYEHLLRDDPALAAICTALPARDVKGFRTAVRAYEVPWLPAGAAPAEPEMRSGTPAKAPALTGLAVSG